MGQKNKKKAQQPSRGSLQDTRLANPEATTHDQPKVEASNMDQQTLQDVGMLPQVCPSQTSGLVTMGEAALDQLSSLTHKALASTTLNSPPVGVDRLLRSRFAAPVTAATLRLRNIRPAES
jgi:hypothetical protein